MGFVVSPTIVAIGFRPVPQRRRRRRERVNGCSFPGSMNQRPGRQRTSWTQERVGLAPPISRLDVALDAGSAPSVAPRSYPPRTGGRVSVRPALLPPPVLNTSDKPLPRPAPAGVSGACREDDRLCSYGSDALYPQVNDRGATALCHGPSKVFPDKPLTGC
jgi:hypothetical protein